MPSGCSSSYSSKVKTRKGKLEFSLIWDKLYVNPWDPYHIRVTQMIANTRKSFLEYPIEYYLSDFSEQEIMSVYRQLFALTESGENTVLNLLKCF